MSSSHTRLASDVNLDEEAEIEAQVVGDPSDASGDRTGSGQEADQGPQEDQVSQEEVADLHGTPQSSTETSAHSQQDASSNVGRVQRTTNPAPMPPTYAEDKMADLRDQATAIMQKVQHQKGLNTYKTTFKAYDAWHRLRFGVETPKCPLTGLMWMHIPTAKSYMQYMAASNQTSSQVCHTPILSPAAHYSLLTRYSLLATRYSLLATHTTCYKAMRL